MKNNLSKKIIFSSIILLGTFLFFSFKNYIQLFTIQCGTDFHGIGEIIENCNEDIVITSLPVDGDLGTIIAGDIKSSGRIRITPGTSSVKIVPKLDGTFNKTIISKGTQPDRRRSIIGGDGGDTGTGKTGNEKTTSYNIINTNGNLIISDLNASIIHYAIYDNYGTVITVVDNAIITNGSIPINHLQNGIYIINIQLDNGEVLTKTIAIQ